jgi:hypothetical protein
MTKKNIKIFNYFNLKSVHLHVRTFFLLLFILCSSSFSAQLIDTIKFSLNQKPNVFFKLDVKNFFINNQINQFKELKVGFVFNDLVRVGVGYSWLKSKRNPYLNQDSSELNINSAILYAEYIFYAQNNWSAEIPVELGIGRISYINTNLPLTKGLYVYYEPSLIIEFSGFEYISLGFGTGFRFTSKNNLLFTEKLSKPVYIFRLKFRFKKIYKDINSNYK